MSLMNDLGVDEALRQFRSFRDDQFRANLAHDRRIKVLDTENQELKSRLSVLTRLWISKGVFTAAEIAAFIVETAAEAKPPATESAAPEAPATPTAPEIDSPNEA